MKMFALVLAVLFFGYSGCIIGGISFASLNPLPNIVDYVADYLERRISGEVPAGATFLIVGFFIGSVPGSLLGSLFGAYWAGELCDFDVIFKWTFLGGIVSPAIVLLFLLGPAVVLGARLLNFTLIALAISSLASPISAAIAAVVTSREISPKDEGE